MKDPFNSLYAHWERKLNHADVYVLLKKCIRERTNSKTAFSNSVEFVYSIFTSGNLGGVVNWKLGTMMSFARNLTSLRRNEKAIFTKNAILTYAHQNTELSLSKITYANKIRHIMK